MAKKRTLNYVSTYTVNPDSEFEMEFSYIKRLKATKSFTKEYGKFYKVRSLEVDGKWGIMDYSGILISELCYDSIGQKVKTTKKGHFVKVKKGEVVSLFNIDTCEEEPVAKSQ